jgi:hypothetical protein
MNKTELVEKLYKSGKITFEEVGVLLSTDTSCDSFNPKSKDQIVDEFINTEVLSGEYKFDSSKCVDYMKSINWNWAPIGKVPDLNQFNSTLSAYIKEVIEKVINRYKLDHDIIDESYYKIESGGIIVEGWLEEDNNSLRLCVHPRFCIEGATFTFTETDTNLLLNNQ